MTRAVLDANILVSAALKPKGPPGRIVERLITSAEFTLVVSPGIEDEIRSALRRPKILRRSGHTPAFADAWLDAVLMHADIVAPAIILKGATPDPDDDKYPEAASAGRAEYIVSGDRHLLDLPARPGVTIVTPTAFLKMLEATNP